MFDKFQNNLKTRTEDIIIASTLPFIKQKAMDHFGFYFEVKRELYGITKINNLIELIKKWKPSIGNMDMNKFQNRIISGKLDLGTYFYAVTGSELYRNSGEGYLKSVSNGHFSEDDMGIYVFGKRSRLYKKQIEEILDRKDYRLKIFSVSGSSRKDSERDDLNCYIQTMNPRSMDSLFFQDGIKNRIINHLDSFKANDKIYKDRNLIYKTGILLYGTPGTGKTSLANAIATYMERNLIVVDMGTFNNLDIAALTSCINADVRKFVVLLEDIDTFFDSLDRDSKTMVKESEGKGLGKLQQFLDSNTSPNDVVFIATTNKIEMLDDSLKRAGRFDLKIDVEGITKPIAHSMCRSFELSEEKTEEIVDRYDGIINQADLQRVILEEIKATINN